MKSQASIGKIIQTKLTKQQVQRICNQLYKILKYLTYNLIKQLIAAQIMSSIKTINQQYKQLKQSKTMFLDTIKGLEIDDISIDQDLEEKHVTIQKLFNLIPNQERLLKISQQIQSQQVNKALQAYHGEYQLVKKVVKKKDQLKAETKIVYYTFSQLNLPKIDNQFKQIIQNQEDNHQNLKLKSYEIMKNKNLKVSKQQKNTINPAKFSQLKQNEAAQIISQSQYLKQDDMLINICLNDSVHNEKVFQYVCLGQMKLNQLKNSFYCLISQLCNQPGQKISIKKQKKQKIKNQNLQNCFFLIQQNFYYHGNSKIQDQIDQVINKIESMSSQKYRKFQMGQTQIKSLRVIFGRPYLFRHLGGCDHTIIFKDLRLYCRNLNQKQFYFNDQEKKTKYPVIVYQSRLKQRRCEGCDIKYSRVVTFSDNLKKGNISYLCKECKANLHNQKTNQNNKIKKSIPYIHD